MRINWSARRSSAPTAAAASKRRTRQNGSETGGGKAGTRTLDREQFPSVKYAPVAEAAMVVFFSGIDV